MGSHVSQDTPPSLHIDAQEKHRCDGLCRRLQGYAHASVWPWHRATWFGLDASSCRLGSGTLFAQVRAMPHTFLMRINCGTPGMIEVCSQTCRPRLLLPGAYETTRIACTVLCQCMPCDVHPTSPTTEAAHRALCEKKNLPISDTPWIDLLPAPMVGRRLAFAKETSPMGYCTGVCVSYTARAVHFRGRLRHDCG